VTPTVAHVGECGDPQHLVSRLDQGVDARLGFEPCVRRPAVDHHLERPGALATGLERTAVTARFEHQDVAAGHRPLLQQRSGRLGLDLLVAREEHLDTGGIGQRCDRVDRLDDPTLHVEHAGPGRPAVCDAERARRQRTHREHRVVVTEDQHLRVASTRPVHVWTGRPVDQRRGPAGSLLDQRRQVVGRCRDRCNVERR